MASRLSRAITRETTRLKHLLAEYNSSMVPSQQLTWEGVCNPSTHIWQQLEQPLDIPVPKSVRIAAINALMTKRRAEEEVVMLQQEMRSFISFYMKDATALTRAIDTLEASEAKTAYDNGCIALLKVRLCNIEQELLSCCSSYNQFVDVPDLTSLSLDMHVPPLDSMDITQEPREIVVGDGMEEDDVEVDPLPSSRYLSDFCLQYDSYNPVSDSDETGNSMHLVP